MKVTIIYDNTSSRPDLQADWGFSALIQVKERNILFDTGANGDILLSNMEKLKVNIKEIEDVLFLILTGIIQVVYHHFFN